MFTSKQLQVGVLIVSIVGLGLAFIQIINPDLGHMTVVDDTGGNLEVFFSQPFLLFSSLGIGFDNGVYGVPTTLQECQTASSYYSQFCTVTSSCSPEGGKYVISGTNCPGEGFGGNIKHFSSGNYLVCTDNGGIFSPTGSSGGQCSVTLPQGCEIKSVTACDVVTGNVKQFSSTCIAPGYTTDLDMCGSGGGSGGGGVDEPPNNTMLLISIVSIVGIATGWFILRQLKII